MADDKKFTEDAYEQTLIALFRDELGYAYECGYDVERDYKEPFYRADLVASMRRLNPELPADAMDEGVKQITNISIGTLEQNNEQFTLWMQNGLEVGFLQDGEERTALMRLIDFDHPERNLFKVVNQWRVEEYKNKRCDMVVMVNGLPLVVVELKSAISEDATVEDAYKQIRNYQQDVPSLFSYNAFNVISDMSETRAGTITAKQVFLLASIVHFYVRKEIYHITQTALVQLRTGEILRQNALQSFVFSLNGSKRFIYHHAYFRCVGSSTNLAPSGFSRHEEDVLGCVFVLIFRVSVFVALQLLELLFEAVADVFQKNESEHHALVLRSAEVASQNVGSLPYFLFKTYADFSPLSARWKYLYRRKRGSFVLSFHLRCYFFLRNDGSEPLRRRR
jgi:hypothetical protein